MSRICSTESGIYCWSCRQLNIYEMFHIGLTKSLSNLYLLQPFHIRYRSQAMSNPCLNLVRWCTLNPYRFNSRLTSGGLGERWWSCVCMRVCAPVHACVVKAEREQRVEKAHIKPSTVYLRSQALFGFKRNNKQMYTWTRKIITGVQGPQCCVIP